MNLSWIITESNPAVLFCLQLLLSTGIYCIYLDRRSYYVLKTVSSLAVFLVCAYGIDQLLYQVNYLVPFFLWLILLPILYFSYQVTWREALFASLAGLATQHCSLLISELFLTQLLKVSPDSLEKLLMIPCYLLLTVAAYWFLGRRIYRETDIRIQSRSLLLIAAAIVLFSMVLRRMVVDNMGDVYSTTMKIAIDLYSVMGCAVSLWLLFFANIVDELKMEQVMMEDVMQMEEEKHQISETAIDTINIKCHDLKHELERMRTGREAFSEQALQEMEDSVSHYANIVRTGNDALDSVLTEESLCCESYHINFRFMADGALLNGMDSTDIYSLFSNAIDNAIEASRAEPDEEKRSIFLRLTGKESYVSIHIENNCPGKIRFRDGIPQTDKVDKASHGYGIKSMQYIVKKYSGNIVFKQENGKFSVNILLSISSDSQS